MTPRQLPLDLPAPARWRREDFFPSPANAAALRAIGGWRDWPSGKMLLVGPEGAGKSHLAHLWAAENGGVVVEGARLQGIDVHALADHGAVAVDGAEHAAGAGEEALFHLHNLTLQGGALLVTARAAPRDWGLALPDLLSRMQATAITHLDAPDDTLLAAVLVKLFADRQLSVAPTLIPFLVARMERSLDAAQRIVAALDARALAEGKPVTKSMAGDILVQSGLA
jgi:chromosomal replication initiation ATPase DnaA